jgi:dGTPase
VSTKAQRSWYERRLATEEKSDSRSPHARDRDRVLYSSEFTRLVGVTQVSDREPGVVLHNRLTHSLKVAQVASRIAERLKADAPVSRNPVVNLMSPDAVEAGALAHDLGHPPFGHVAEQVLDEVASSFGGFNGNAQSFRIVVRLSVGRRDRTKLSDPAVSLDPRQGLNLTRGTLNAILKYPWRRHDYDPGRRDKFGVYADEADVFEWVRRSSSATSAVAPPDDAKSLEASIMDWSDDVTYAVHDFQDFVWASTIDIAGLAEASSDAYVRFDSYLAREGRDPDGELRAALAHFAKQLELAVVAAPEEHWPGNLQQLCSGTIHDAIEKATVDVVDGYPQLVVSGRSEIEMLKQAIWCFVIKDENDLGRRQQFHRTVVQTVVNEYLERVPAIKSLSRALPGRWREMVHPSDANANRRLVIDFVSGMTEDEILVRYDLLTGRDSQRTYEKLARVAQDLSN